MPDGGRVLLENIFPLNEDDSRDIAPGGECPVPGPGGPGWLPTGVSTRAALPDALRKNLGDFGNLNDRSLRNIWEGAEYRSLRATYMTRALCQGCNMRRPR